MQSRAPGGHPPLRGQSKAGWQRHVQSKALSTVVILDCLRYRNALGGLSRVLMVCWGWPCQHWVVGSEDAIFSTLIPALFFQEKERGRSCRCVWSFHIISSLQTATQQTHMVLPSKIWPCFLSKPTRPGLCMDSVVQHTA